MIRFGLFFRAFLNKKMIEAIGKILFPRQAAWQRKRQMRIMLWIIPAAICFALLVGALIYLANSKR